MLLFYFAYIKFTHYYRHNLCQDTNFIISNLGIDTKIVKIYNGTRFFFKDQYKFVGVFAKSL